MAAALVVSRVRLDESLAPDEENSVELINEDGSKSVLVARIESPSGHKCERCWRYLDLSDHGLCGRCEDVVKEEHPHLLESSA
jgi:hypothetical protein